jgi:hypothetical protein
LLYILSGVNRSRCNAAVIYARGPQLLAVLSYAVEKSDPKLIKKLEAQLCKLADKQQQHAEAEIKEINKLEKRQLEEQLKSEEKQQAKAAAALKRKPDSCDVANPAPKRSKPEKPPKEAKPDRTTLSADAVAILLKQIHLSAATQEELEKSIWMSFQNNAHDSYRGGKPTQKAIVSVFAQPPNHTFPSDWSRRSYAEIEDPRSVGEQRACAAGGGGLDQNVVTNFLDELP